MSQPKVQETNSICFHPYYISLNKLKNIWSTAVTFHTATFLTMRENTQERWSRQQWACFHSQTSNNCNSAVVGETLSACNSNLTKVNSWGGEVNAMLKCIGLRSFPKVITIYSLFLFCFPFNNLWLHLYCLSYQSSGFWVFFITCFSNFAFFH